MAGGTATQHRVVIIGAGFGGLRAVRALAHAPVQVTLIDRENHHTFQPLLYQVATAGLEAAEVAFPLRSLLRRQKNATVLMAEVESIDATGRQVHLAGGHVIPFDYLVLATGAKSSYPQPIYRLYAPSLKSLRDALEIRYRVLMAFERAEQEGDPERQRQLMTFVVVGAGPTGVELAGAIAELAHHTLKRDFRHIDPTSARVILLQGVASVLPTYPPKLQASARRQLESLGVEVRTSTLVRSIDDSGVDVDGEHIAARTVLWAGGVLATPLGRALGPVDHYGRVPVDGCLNPPGLPHVFVIGDAAIRSQDGQPIPGVAPAAIQGGRYAARAIVKRIAGEPVGPFHFRFKGELATIGRSRAVADLPGGIRLSGFLAWALYMTVHLFYLSGFRRRVLVFLSWIWSYFTWARGARLIPSALAAAHVREIIERHELPSVEAPPPAPPPSLH